jgi:hypothetical protein
MDKFSRIYERNITKHKFVLREGSFLNPCVFIHHMKYLKFTTYSLVFLAGLFFAHSADAARPVTGKHNFLRRGIIIFLPIFVMLLLFFAKPAYGARVFTSGAEMNSTTNGEEFDTVSSATIDATTYRSGAYALKSNPASATQYIQHQYAAGATTNDTYFRFYLYADSASSGGPLTVLQLYDTTAAGQVAAIQINDNGAVELWGNSAQLESDSSPLNLDTWYRIEISVVGTTITAYIDGTQFATGSANASYDDANRFSLGVITSGTADFYFDDIAVNDQSGSNQTGLPGSGKVIRLLPDSVGDVNTFEKSGGTAGDSNNYNQEYEINPDDATTYLRSTTLNQEDMYNCGASGIGINDIVNVVQVRLRARRSAATSPTIRAQVKKTSGGTISQGSTWTPNSTTWRTDANAVPYIPTLTLYQDPDSANWTKSTLDTMQIGMKVTTDNSAYVQVSTVMAQVDYTPKDLTNVYYSVGQTTNDLKTGAPTLTISSGTATFSVEQTGNIGVGDRVTYNTTSIAYISGKISTTQWSLVTKLGETPADVGSAQTVNSITREYTSLSLAEDGAEDSNHLNNIDLTDSGINVILNFPCYFDTGSDTTPVAVNGWTTSVANYIKIYTPVNTNTEANFSQRHDGKWNESKYQLKYTGTSTYLLEINEENVRVDGLQIYETNAGNGNEPIVLQSVTGVSTVYISNNIVRGAGDYGGGSSPYGILAWDDAGSGDSNMFVYNNVIFDYYNSSCAGIMNGDAEVDLYAYNNTLFNMDYSLANIGGGIFIAKNNLIQNSDSCFYSTMTDSGYNICDNAEGDYSTPIETGNTDGIGGSASVLRDTGQNFLTTVKPFMLVHNTTDNTYETVKSVDSNTQLTLFSDIMDDSEDYEILPEYYVNLNATPDMEFFQNEYAADFRLNTEETVAKNGGENIYADTALPVTTDIEGQPRPSTGSYIFDIGADEALNPVYYSVGQNTTSHETGAGTVTVSGMKATFSVPQTAENMGVGDVIDYGGSNSKCYISGKISESEWTCTSAIGGLPTQATTATVNSVSHAFSSLAGAITGATGPNYLNTSDLTLGNYQLNFPCYYDSGADTTFANVDGYATSQTNFIRIYTPTNSDTECNQSQRHQGKWDDGKYRLELGNFYAIILQDGYIKIDGLQVKSTSTNASSQQAIFASNNPSTSQYFISNNIIQGYTSNTYDYYDGISIYDAGTAGSTAYIWNNIIYNFVGTTTDYGIDLNDPDFTAYVYNNTVYNAEREYSVISGNMIAKNNIAQNSGSYGYYYQAGSFDDSSTNNIDDFYDAPGSNPQEGVTVSFVNATNKDFHLLFSNTTARKIGANLSNDYYLPFNTDIDGHSRGPTWDIGADESSETATASSGELQKTSNDNGLVLYHSFDGNAVDWGGSTPVAKDQSGQGNDGTIYNGAGAVIGRKGQAISFDGVDDFIEASDESSLNFGTGSFTVSAWVNFRSFPSSDYFTIADKMDYSMWSGWFFGINSSGSIRFNVDDGTNEEQVSTGAISTNTWYHVVAVVDRANTDQLVYINGSQSGNIPDITGDGGYDSQDGVTLMVGSGHNSTANEMSGKIDELRIYNRALSPTEVADLYKVGEQKMNMSLAGKNTNGLIGHWTFDGANISGNTAVDSWYGNNGRILGPVPAIGKKGQALYFDGTDDRVDLNAQIDVLGTTHTVSVWIDYQDTGDGIIIGRDTNGYLMYLDQTNVYYWDGNVAYVSVAHGGLTAGEWYNLTTVRNGTAVSFYKNGSQIGTTQTLSGNSSIAGIEYFGSYAAGTYPAKMRLDEVRLYNRALSPEEVQDLYKLGQTTMGR